MLTIRSDERANRKRAGVYSNRIVNTWYKRKVDNDCNQIVNTHGTCLNSSMGNKPPLGKPGVNDSIVGSKKGDVSTEVAGMTLGIDIQEIQSTPNPELASRPGPLVRV